MEKKEIICPNCSSAVDSGAKFCTSCGSKVESTDTTNFCSNCGTLNPEQAQFCGTCGGSLKEKSLGDYSYQKTATQRKGLVQKLFEDTGKALEDAKEEIAKSITDYTHAAESETIETYNSIIVKIELPMVKKDDLDVNISPRSINVRAAFDQNVTTQQGHHITHDSRQRGHINKTVKLPKTVVPEKAEAEFRNHYLIIEIPKEEIEKSHKLDL